MKHLVDWVKGWLREDPVTFAILVSGGAFILACFLVIAHGFLITDTYDYSQQQREWIAECTKHKMHLECSLNAIDLFDEEDK